MPSPAARSQNRCVVELHCAQQLLVTASEQKAEGCRTFGPASVQRAIGATSNPRENKSIAPLPSARAMTTSPSARSASAVQGAPSGSRQTPRAAPTASSGREAHSLARRGQGEQLEAGGGNGVRKSYLRSSALAAPQRTRQAATPDLRQAGPSAAFARSARQTRGHGKPGDLPAARADTRPQGASPPARVRG